jgi:hypothetical protein
LVERIEDGKDNAFTTSGVRETCHGAGATANLAEHPLNPIRIWYENGGA